MKASNGPITKKTRNQKLSVVEALRESPEIFGNFLFSITWEDNNKEYVDEAKDRYQKKFDIVPKHRDFDNFEGWGLKKEDWPIDFISIHQGSRGGLWVRFLQRGQVIKTKKSDVHFAPKANLFKDKPDVGNHLVD